jgi:hypothetical protein
VSRRDAIADGLVSGSGIVFSTLSTIGGTSRDVSTILSGSGWHMSGSRIQVTATSIATATDGHREGACLLLDMPSGWRGDGTQGVVFRFDDLLWPTAAGSLMWLGAGIVEPGADQTVQNGGALAMHDNTGPTVRGAFIGATSLTGGTNLGATMTDMDGLVAPVYSGGVLQFGRYVSSCWSGTAGTKAATIGVASLLNGATSSIATSPKIALCAGFTGTTVGTARTFGARVRVALINIAPIGGAVL